MLMPDLFTVSDHSLTHWHFRFVVATTCDNGQNQCVLYTERLTTTTVEACWCRCARAAQSPEMTMARRRRTEAQIALRRFIIRRRRENSLVTRLFITRIANGLYSQPTIVGEDHGSWPTFTSRSSPM